MKLVVANAPHVRTDDSVRKIMIDVLIALMPAVIGAVIFFGWYSLIMCIIGAFFAEFLEMFIVRILRKQKNFKPDGSATVTGLLLALNLSPIAPWWLILIGVMVAIGVAKQAFGGIGQNFFNPALVGRAFLLMSFPTYMTTWVAPKIPFSKMPWDVVTSATPLGILKEQGFSKAIESSGYWNLFIGNVGGCIGETSALLLLIGFAYLVVRKRVTLTVPSTYIGTVFLVASVMYLINPERFGSPLFHILSGGLFLGAFFMATDMVTSPMTLKGQAIFGIGCGVITMVIRLFASYPEGVSLSILIMNGLVPLIDRATKPRVFGEVKT
ncbi:MAG: electron transporter RnfD [Thermotogae bacterium]|nr:MAG: electron transporter RnfD [Thermotogota bacterium]